MRKAFSVRSVSNTTWSEAAINYSNSPAVGNVAAVTNAPQTGTWVSADVTSVVTAGGPLSVALTSTSATQTSLAARETGSTAPQLVVVTGSAATTTTTPSAATTTSSTTTTTSSSSTTTSSSSSTTTSSSSTTSSTTATTVPTGGGDPLLAAAGDIACDPTDTNFNGGLGTATGCQMGATSDLILGLSPDAVLALGDVQYSSGSSSQFAASYDPSWGRVKLLTHPAVGNHEYGTSGASGYFNYFGPAAGVSGKGYYSFDVGTWHIIAINSNCTNVTGGCAAGSAQEQWLRADLAAHPATCTLAYWHHPRYSSGHDGDNLFMTDMWQALYDGGADLVLSGHSHDYERFAPQNNASQLDAERGIRQFVVGTGGAFFTGIGTPHANSEVLNNTAFGVLRLTLHPSGYDWRFLAAAGSTFPDSGSGACH